MNEASEPHIPSYMALAVGSTMLCFPPTGLWAIVQAARVMTLLDAGDRAGALAASRSARRWVIISGLIGLAILLTTITVGAAAIVYVLRVIIPQIEQSGR